MDLLKQTYNIAKQHNVEIVLMAGEQCSSLCPFRTEHNLWQANLEKTNHRGYHNKYSYLSCYPGKTSLYSPREDSDIVCTEKSQFDKYLKNCDMLKYSGRLNYVNARVGDGTKHKYVYVFLDTKNIKGFRGRELFWADSFSEIYEKSYVPFNFWTPGALEVSSKKTQNIDIYNKIKNSSPWGTPEGVELSKKLMNCKNECYKCHLCEKVFGLENYDSLYQFKIKKI